MGIMNTEEQLEQLRKEWRTATPDRRFAIELEARGLKMALRARKEDKNILDIPEILERLNPPFKYEAKTLFTGFKIGLKNASLYVLVPAKYWEHNAIIEVTHEGKSKKYQETDIVKKIVLPDKIVEGKDYPVTYLLWKK